MRADEAAGKAGSHPHFPQGRVGKGWFTVESGLIRPKCLVGDVADAVLGGPCGRAHGASGLWAARARP